MSHATALGPVPGDERIAGLDVARGVAVLGVLLMNIWAFAGPQAWFDYPLAIADRAGAPVATWVVVHTLFEGSQRALLSLLFGAGALLALQRFERIDPAAARGTYYRRTLLLSAFGLVNAYVFLWPADILFVYGLAGVFLYPLRRLRTRTLVAVALATLAVPAGLRVAELADLRALEAGHDAALAARAAGEPLTASQQADVAGWERALAKAQPDPADAKTLADIRTMQSGTLAEVWARQARVSLILQTVVAANWWFLDALAMMILGMVLCRTGLVTRPQPAARYVALAVAGFAIGLPLALWQTQTLLASGFDPVAVETAKLGYDLRRLGMALGWLGLVLLFCQAARGAWLKRPLAATGRMALTNYLAQSVVCALVFYGFGLGLYGRVTGYWLYVIVALVWALEIAWSVAWLARFRIGPCEWLWRSLIYRRAQCWRTPLAPVAPVAGGPHA
jgi:uncharacterized protein